MSVFSTPTINELSLSGRGVGVHNTVVEPGIVRLGDYDDRLAPVFTAGFNKRFLQHKLFPIPDESRFGRGIERLSSVVQQELR